MPITATRAWEEAAATVDASEVILPTLELIHSVFVEDGRPAPIRAVRNNEDLPCPSSDDLGHLAVFRSGGSGPSGVRG